MEALYFSLENIDESGEYKVSPFQQIVFSSMDFINAELQREGTSLILVVTEQRKSIVLYDFFKAEDVGFFPTIILPTKECLSGFGFVALLNPSLLQGNILAKGGSYGNPEGSYIDYLYQRKKVEEGTQWVVSPVLFTAPQSEERTSIHVHHTEDESPEFYSMIEDYIANVQTQEAISSEHTAEYREEYSEDSIPPVEHETQDVFPSYHSGYIFTQEQLEQGYRVVAVNGESEGVEQMIGGYYGYLTLASEGWFTYILGEGIFPEQDSYLEDTYSYTVQNPQGELIEGSIVVQSYYVEGVLTYKEYYTEL